MREIYESQIVDTLEVCPYCMNPPKGHGSCCGEVHYEEAYDIGDEILLASEVVFKQPLPRGAANVDLDAVVPLQDVKAALQVANAKNETYSSATLAFLVRKYTVFGFLVLAILANGCAPQVQLVPIDQGPPIPGPKGDTGAPGQNCTVTAVANGALINCPDGTQAVVLNGQDAQAGAYDIVGTVDPCGKEAAFDEVLLKLANGQFMAHYASGAKQFLAIIGPGNYTVTDGTGCKFTITNSGEVTNEHH